MKPANSMTQKEYNSMRGWKNKKAGELFEKMLEAACEYYKAHNLAYIEKTPEPFRVLGRENEASGRIMFRGVFRKKGQPDFKGTIQGGKSICFEAKHTDADKIEQGELTDEQSTSLKLHSQLGAAAFVVVSIQMRSFYRVPWDVWENMKAIYGRKHMKAADLEQYILPFDGTIKLLDGLKLQGGTNTHEQ